MKRHSTTYYKRYIVLVYCLFMVFFYSSTSQAQQKISPDSLRMELRKATEDSVKVRLLQTLGFTLLFIKPDTTLILYRQALDLARQNGLTRQEASVLSYLSAGLSISPGKKDSVLFYMQLAMTLSRQNKFFNEEVVCYSILSSVYSYVWKQYDSAFLLMQQGIDLADKYQLADRQLNLRITLIYLYWQAKKFDEAFKLCLDGIRDSRKRNLTANEIKFKNQAYYVMAQTKSVDTIMLLSQQGISFAQDLGDKTYEAFFLKDRGERLKDIGQSPTALQAYLESLEIYTKLNNKIEMAALLYGIGLLYLNQQDYQKSLSYFLKAKDIQETTVDSSKMYSYEMIGNSYAKLKMNDSAIYFARRSYDEAVKVGNGYVPGGILNDLGELYAELGQDSLSMYYFRRSLPDILSNRIDYYNECEIYIGIAKLFRKSNNLDSSVYYAHKALLIAQEQFAYNFVYDACKIITDFYKHSGRIDSAFYYQETGIAAKDSLFNQDKVKAIRNTEINEQIREQQVKESEIRYRNKVTTYGLVGVLGAVLIIAGILYRNNRQKQKTNTVLEKTLSNLKSTQAQLIQSEKMASLGQLTAGIAHEIQNPLNFVNNFSDVNKEMLEELKAERLKPTAERDEQAEAEIIDDVLANEEKINHHGKRADAIVKGMLQHSRTSTGVKELTDINALADEYLRLAYHGMRGKDKMFNATMQTDFDSSIGKINIIPQDIGRVLLNLYNNAFYAASLPSPEKIGTGAGGFSDPDKSYNPTVSVQTRKINDKVEIIVKDNGNGIPQNIIDKIFQPFFTTKPTGQGTGLGLSLAYDIVKAHGGEINVETKEEEGSIFIIQLPNK